MKAAVRHGLEIPLRQFLRCAFVGLLLYTLTLTSPLLKFVAPVRQTLSMMLAVLVVLLSAEFAEVSPKRALWGALLPVSFIMLTALLYPGSLPPALALAVSSCLLMVGCAVGSHLGSLITQPSMLTVTAYAAALGDVFSVAHPHGITAEALKHPRVLQLLAISIPLLGTSRLVPIVGVGDVAFASMFMVASRAASLSIQRTRVALLLALLACATCAELFTLSLPAIPFMSVAVVLAHKQAWKLESGPERRAVRGLMMLTIVLGALWFASQGTSAG